MTPEVEGLFAALADLSPAQRAEYFAAHAVDPALRAEVESLLQHDAATGAALAAPIVRAASSLLTGAAPRRCGAYELRELLGRGGMGSVYRAERADGEVQSEAAVKLISGAGDAGAVERFLRERQILAGLSHPHIAALLDAGRTETGEPYFVMELVRGRRIDDFAAGLGPRDVVTLFLKICAAVQFAHSRLVVHRDLKPNNILVTADGTPKLLDFGIAKLLTPAAGATSTLERLVTPGYGSPEQVAGREVTTASDVYGLGAVLFKILTGKSPHEGGGSTPEAMLAAALTADAPRARTLRPELPADLDAILAKALRREPEARYATVDQLASDLRAWLASRPVRAREGEWAYRAGKFVRRHWIPLAAAAASVAALTIGLLIAVRERRLADERFQMARELAGKLFQVEEKIHSLTGSTSAREFIAETALRYLDRLSAKAAEPELLAELGDGYVSLARVLMHRGDASLGKEPEAKAALEKSVVLLRRARAADPRNRGILKSLILAECEALTMRGPEQRQEAPQRARGVTPLLEEFERQPDLKPAEFRILVDSYNKLHLTLINTGHTGLSRRPLEKAVDLARRRAAASPGPEATYQLASGLRLWGTFLRYEGELEGAAASLEEAAAVVQRLPERRMKAVEAASIAYYQGSVLGEVDALSLGRRDAAAAAFERSMALVRPLIQKDPADFNARLDFALPALRLARILRDRDPARALAVYSETLAVMTAAPQTASRRKAYLIRALAGSSFALRRLGREPEARAKIAEARALDACGAGKAVAGPSSHCEALEIAAAEAEAAAGRPGRAIEIYRRLLADFDREGAKPREDLADGLAYSLKYARLEELLAAPGTAAEAAGYRRQRRELWLHWAARLPGNTFVATQLAAAK